MISLRYGHHCPKSKPGKNTYWQTDKTDSSHAMLASSWHVKQPITWFRKSAYA
jgi:hypothetical protein